MFKVTYNSYNSHEVKFFNTKNEVLNYIENQLDVNKHLKPKKLFERADNNVTVIFYECNTNKVMEIVVVKVS